MFRFLCGAVLWFGASLFLLATESIAKQTNEIALEQQAQSLDASPPTEANVSSEATATETEIGLSSSHFLPLSTRAWFSIPDAIGIEGKFDQSQIGQMFQQDEVRPFFEDAWETIKQQLDEKNVRIGLNIEDILKVRSGEVCVAGVFQDLDGGQPARGSHGLVLLVDVTGNEAIVEEVLERLDQDFADNPAAVVAKLQIAGQEVTQISVENPKRIRHSRHTYHVTHAGWLLLADNEDIFRDVLGRIVTRDLIDFSLTLSQKPDFKKIMSESSLLDSSPDISWYMDPVGYLELIHKINAEEQEIRTHKEDWPSKLKEIGFDAVAGVGGNIGVGLESGEQEFEMLSKIFVYAPKQNLSQDKQVIFDLFDFSPRNSGATTPGDLVGGNSSGFFGGSWNFTRLLNGIGPIYNIIVGSKDQDAFEKLLTDLAEEPDLQVDIRKIISMLDNQIFFMSEIDQPIDLDSEHIAVCIPLAENANPDFIFKSLSRAARGNRGGEIINLGGIKVIEVDSTLEDDLGFEEDFGVPGLDLEPEDEPQKRLVMFEKRYITVHRGHLLVVNNKKFMRNILAGRVQDKLREADDYRQVSEILNDLTDPSKIAFRRFVRNDRIIETNYQLLRRGDLANAQTLMFRVINHLMESDPTLGQDESQAPRLKGELLPEEFDLYIAPFIGPTGWVIEVEDDGWRITGCTIAK